MRTYDLSPLFRSTVGFDRLSSMLEAANRMDDGASAGGGYPPYNIEKHGDDQYAVTVAVAGFSEADLDIQLQDQTLTVKGKIGGFDRTNNGTNTNNVDGPKLKTVDGAEAPHKVEFLHRGIATRSFERRFQLADHIKVGNARLDHGLLVVDLVRELPEALKPRKISISGGLNSGATNSLEHGGAGHAKVIDNVAA